MTPPQLAPIVQFALRKWSCGIRRSKTGIDRSTNYIVSNRRIVHAVRSKFAGWGSRMQNRSDFHDFLLFMLQNLIDLAFVGLGQFLNLFLALLGFVLRDHASLLLGFDQLVRIAAGGADSNL